MKESSLIDYDLIPNVVEYMYLSVDMWPYLLIIGSRELLPLHRVQQVLAV